MYTKLRTLGIRANTSELMILSLNRLIYASGRNRTRY
jgi:hypothetical protein